MYPVLNYTGFFWEECAEVVCWAGALSGTFLLEGNVSIHWMDFLNGSLRAWHQSRWTVIYLNVPSYVPSCEAFFATLRRSMPNFHSQIKVLCMIFFCIKVTMLLKRPPVASSWAPHCAGHSRDLGSRQRSAYQLIPGVRGARAQWKFTGQMVTPCWVSKAGLNMPSHPPLWPI